MSTSTKKLAVIEHRTQCPHRTGTGDGWGPDLQFCKHPRSDTRPVDFPALCEGGRGGRGFPPGCPLPDA